MRGFEDVAIDWAPADMWLDERGTCQQSVRFIVPGKPEPKGSVIKGRWGGYHSANKNLACWCQMVDDQARAAMNGSWRSREDMAIPFALKAFVGSVKVDIEFVMPRPKTFTPPKYLEKDRALWKATFVNGHPPHLKKVDVDKCIRGVCDAMTGIVWYDDSQVTDVRGRKRYAYPDESTGAIISVTSDVRVT